MSNCKLCGKEKSLVWVQIHESKKVGKNMCVTENCPNYHLPPEAISSVAGGFITDKPKESDKWENFSYRAGYLKEQAQGERRAAEGKSHMGPNPYPSMR